MAFNADKFYKTKHERPTFDYPAPDFKEWFDEGEEPVFKIRGLTAVELNTAQNAEESIKTTENLFDAIGENLGGKNKEAMKKMVAAMLGKESDEESGDNGFTARMKQTLEFGLCDENIDFSVVNKMVDYAPVQMMQMFYKITELTAQVGVAAKKKPIDSGKTKE